MGQWGWVAGASLLAAYYLLSRGGASGQVSQPGYDDLAPPSPKGKIPTSYG